MNHSFLHKQALIKNNICTSVIEFSEHNEDLMEETISKFDYDLVINTCEINVDPSFGASWDGANFNIKHFSSWILGEDLQWHPPVPKPEGNYNWDEENQVWVEYTTLQDGSTEI